MVEAVGGVSAIAISHPHYYTAMVEWSRAFGGVPVHLHAADRQWVMRPDKAIAFWDGETLKLGEGLMLVRCGGHFEGGTVLHWQGGADGKGAILTGDIIQVVADRKHVSFMYSYPNYVPALGGSRRADRPGGCTVRVREGVRRILGHGDRAWRQGRSHSISGAVSAGDQRQ